MTNRPTMRVSVLRSLLVIGPALVLHASLLIWLCYPTDVRDPFSTEDLFGLACLELSMWGVVLGLVLAWLTAWSRLTHTSKVGRLLLWVISYGGIVAVLGAVATAYWSSWALYRSTNQFIGVDTFHLWQTSSYQLLQHAMHLEPDAVLGVPLLAGLTVLAGYGLTRIAGRWLTEQRLYRIAIFYAGGCLAMLLFGIVVAFVTPKSDRGVLDPDIGVVYGYTDLFAFTRDEAAGPISRIVFSLCKRFADDSLGHTIDPTTELQWKPIVELNHYVASVQAQPIEKKNVLIIVVESLRSDELTMMGGDRVVMPYVEQLATQARCFSRHYTQASHSNYADLCLLSSHYPLRSKSPHVYPEKPAYPRVLVYDVLKALGYRTAIFSSQNEHWGAMINYLDTGSLDVLFHSQSYEGDTYVPVDDVGFAKMAASGRSGKIDDRITVSQALAWIEEEPTQPFCMYMNLQNSHVPYVTPSDFPRRFGQAQLPFKVRFGSFPRDDHSVSLVKDRYSDSLAYVDSQIGRLLERLSELGVLEETIVVITGDTGQAFFEHGFAAHANGLYNEVMRVPLIIYDQDLSPTIDQRPAQHIDIPPSIFALLGLPPHPSFQGINLFSDDVDPHRSLFLTAQSPLAHQFAIVKDSLKLIYDHRKDRAMLYDLDTDPAETSDLFASKPKQAAKLRALLDSWRKAQLDYYADPQISRKWYPPILTETERRHPSADTASDVVTGAAMRNGDGSAN